MNTNRRSEGTEPLLLRQALNQGSGVLDLGKFIAEHARFSMDSAVLDVGAGAGEPILSCIRAAGIRRYRALDCSPSSLGHLEEAARVHGITVDAVTAEMDALASANFRPDWSGLSHITAVYSLYYSRQADTLLAGLRQRLASGGSLVVVGPAPGNNREWFDFLSSAGVPLSDGLRSVSESFFPDVVQPFAERNFEESSCFDAENPVTLNSVETLEQYWRSNIYHDAGFDDAVRSAAMEMFRNQPVFTITKRIRLLHAGGRN